ncbi:hypothetical protein [Stieleria mannarensis]|uniref:hypothetical protein n=1 Tax=Stieleria mannarensis TaxID=2755585 RepID=UPI0015FEF1EB|nr:hypothetical protein [Rhodopirellula sp. JC639]
MSASRQECMGYGLFGRCSPTSGSDEPGGTPAEIHISGSVGRQGKNLRPDVKSIQQALNRVPVNQGRPNPILVVDGLNGPKTERAIYIFQKHHFGATRADARVDPGHRTITKLNELQPAAGASGGGSGGSGGSGGGSAGPGASSFVPMTDSEKDVMTRVNTAVNRAERWALRAVIELLNALQYLEGKKAQKPSYDLVDRCFKIKSLSTEKQQVHAINKIIKIFNRYPRARRAVRPFVRTGGSCTNDKGHAIFAEAIPGGFHMEVEDHKRVKVCVKNMKGKDVTFMTDAMVHEMAHLVGPANGKEKIMHGGRKDAAYGLAALSLTHSEAMISASNYAWLAWLARLPKSEWMTNTG